MVNELLEITPEPHCSACALQLRHYTVIRWAVLCSVKPTGSLLELIPSHNLRRHWEQGLYIEERTGHTSFGSTVTLAVREQTAAGRGLGGPQLQPGSL